MERKLSVATNKAHQVLEDKGKNIRYVVHMSDIHIKLINNHEKCRHVFKNLFKQLKQLKLNENNSVIVIGGDIVHEHTMIGDTIAVLKEFFTGLAKITRVFVIIGNHDRNMNNLSDLDSISPVIGSSFQTVNPVHILLDNCVYKYNNINFGVTTMEKKMVTPCDKKDGITNIGLYHGKISGCVDESGIEYKNSDETKTYFNSKDFTKYYDYVMLGDVHKHQYMNPAKTVWYSGPLYQTKRIESVNNGYVLLDLEANTSELQLVKNDYGMFNIKINDDGTNNIAQIKTLPKNLDIKIDCSYKNKEKLEEIYKILDKRKINLTNAYEHIDYSGCGLDMNIDINGTKVDMLTDKTSICKTLINYIKSNNTISQDQETRIIEKTNNFLKQTKIEKEDICKNIQLDNLIFDNVLIYGKGNNISFDKFNGIMLISEKNNTGKTSLIDAILIAIYGCCTREGRRYNLLHKGQNYYTTEINLTVNNTKYKIKRHASICGKVTNMEKDASEKVYLYKNGVNISEPKITATNEKIERVICSYDELITTCLVCNLGESFVLMKTDDKRRLLCKITNIDIYESLLAHIKKEYNNSTRNIISKINKRFNEYFKYSPSDKLILQNIDKKLNELDNNKKQLNDDEKQVAQKKQSISDKLVKIEYHMEQIEQDKLFKLDIKDNNEDELEEKIKYLGKKVNSCEGKIENEREQIQHLNKSLKTFNKIESKNTAFNKKKKESINKLNKEINKLNRDIIFVEESVTKKSINKVNDKIQKLEEQLNKYQKEVQTLTTVKINKTKIKSITEKYNVYEQNIYKQNESKNVIQKITKELNELKSKILQFETYEYNKNCQY